MTVPGIYTKENDVTASDHAPLLIGCADVEQFRYRISNTLDPEERLEDAAMAKAMHDICGASLVSEGPADFGRDKRFEGLRKNIAYWRDPAFLKRAGRSVEVHDVDGAKRAIANLHSEGRGAFVKAVDLKLFAIPVPIGMTLHDAIGDLIWSVLDRPQSIMVQPLCDVRFEVRFVSICRKVVTSSPVAWHLTPLSRLNRGDLFETPRSLEPQARPKSYYELRLVAESAAEDCEQDCVIIDCAMIDGRPGVVEFNPFSLGNFGLYACDPYAIARAIASLHRPKADSRAVDTAKASAPNNSEPSP